MKKMVSLLLVLAMMLAAMPLALAQEDDAGIRYKEPITLTWMTTTTEDYPMDDSNEALKKIFDVIAEKTNVTVKWVPVPAADYQSVYTTTLLTSQKDWPNLMTNACSTINDDGYDGAFVRLDDIMAEKMPNVYAEMEALNAWSSIIDLTYGAGYAVPRTRQMQNAKSYLLRLDLVEACGLEEPTTLAEFADCLRAIKAYNADKVPENMNYPFVARGNVVDWVSQSYGAWGMHSIYWTANEQGVYELNMRKDAWRECLKFWHQLYEEGLIDPEIIVGDTNRWLSYMNNGYAAATIDYSVRASQFTDALRFPSEDAQAAGVKPEENALVVGLVPLSLEKDGFATIAGNNPVYVQTCVGITTACSKEETEAAFCLLNYIYSEEGRQLLSWGLDGWSYDGLDENGNPNWKADLSDNYSIAKTSEYGIQPGIARPLTEAEDNFTYQGINGEAKRKNQGHYEPLHPAGLLTDAEWAEHGTIFTDVQTLYMAAVSEFLTGKRSLDDEGWAQFQRELDERNADRLMELQNKSIQQAAEKLAELGIK